LGLWGEFLKSHFSKLTIFYVFFFTFAFKAPVAHGFGTVGEVAEKPCAAKLVGKPITKFRIGSLSMKTFRSDADTNQKDKQFVPNAVRLLPFGPRGNKTGNIDWTREKLAIKVGQIARMVKGMGSPELMAMVELENNLMAGRSSMPSVTMVIS
jgi:hypothetical protein